jgi:tetratricopeptide (TPR) repeat protein
MQYKGTHKRLPEIARELNVDAVLEGTLFRNKSRVRIDVKLIRAASDEHLWQETYEADLGDMLVLANEISSNIAQRIAVRLSADERHALISATPTNADAYEASLKGRFFWNQRSLPALQKGIGYFQTAIAADSRSAPAYAGLASCYNMLTFYGGQPPRESFPRAKAAALRAIAIDEKSAEAHAALAFALLHYDWNWTGAEREFRRAIELNPNYPDARHWFSHLLLARGRTAEALAEARTALVLDPLSLSVNTHLGHHYLQARSYDAAIAHLRQTLEMYPSAEQVHFWLGRAYEAKKQFADAERELRQASELSPANAHFRAALAHVHASAGNTTKAKAILAEISALSAKQYVSAYSLAILYAGMKDRAHTFEQLRRAQQERAEGILYLNIEPYFDELRDFPEFAQITRDVGL